MGGIQLVVVPLEKQVRHMKMASAIRMIFGRACIVGVALALAVGTHVAPSSADDTDPTFEPLVVNSIFKPRQTKTILEPQGITSLRDHEKRIESGYAILLRLQSPVLDEMWEQCACGNFLIWEEFGRRQREAY